MDKNSRPISRVSLSALAALSMAALCGGPVLAQQRAIQPQVLHNATVNEALHADVSPPLASLLATAPARQSAPTMHAPIKPKVPQGTSAAQGASAAATSAAATSAVRPLANSREPADLPISAARLLGFAGVDLTGDTLDCGSISGHHYVPPDTNAAVGDTQVVQWVNVCYAVFDKATGALIAGPFVGTNFWKGFGGPCEAHNDGDVIIQWDKANHRWLASQNVFNAPVYTGPFYTCIAVSQTADATGSYYRYTFPQPGFPDYPKWGLTHSVYYQTQNNFGPDGNSFVGVTVCAYDARRMLRGSQHAHQVCIADDSNGTLFDDSMLPADDDSVGPGGPEILLGAIDNFFPGDTHVYEYVFTIDFEEPENATLAGVNGSMPISVPAFDLAECVGPGNTFCVPQPGPDAEDNPGAVQPDLLDTLGDRLMYRLARYVDAAGTQHFLVNHSVNDTRAVAVRWYEFRAPEGSTSLSLYQSGQTPDDGHFRWMGSAAMDRAGDIALGYSRSSAREGDHPSIYYSGQTAGDPLGTTEAEALIKKGHGSQFKSLGRWGDYSSMALDGADSCTFWYTNEYYPEDGTRAWATWIASLKFPNCGP